MEEYKKVTISFTKDQLDKLDEIMKREQGYSRSSLVREAVDNYIGYRVQKENISLFVSMMVFDLLFRRIFRPVTGRISAFCFHGSGVGFRFYRQIYLVDLSDHSV